MDSATNQRLGDHEQRLARVEQRLAAADEQHDTLRREVRRQMAASDEEFWGYIHTTDEKLRQIGRQNAALSESVEMLGRFVATSNDALVEHLGEGDEDR